MGAYDLVDSGTFFARVPRREPRYVDAVELLRWLDREIAETIDSDQRMGLQQARDHVAQMDRRE